MTTTSVTANKRSFTFVELILVIAIISVMTGLAIPLVRSSYSAGQLQGFAGTLRSAVGYARERAIVEARPLALVFASSAEELTLRFYNETEAIKTYRVPEGVTATLQEHSPGSSDGMMAFFPDGSIEQATITIQRGNTTIGLTSKGVWGGVKVVSGE